MQPVSVSLSSIALHFRMGFQIMGQLVLPVALLLHQIAWSTAVSQTVDRSVLLMQASASAPVLSQMGFRIREQLTALLVWASLSLTPAPSMGEFPIAA